MRRQQGLPGLCGRSAVWHQQEQPPRWACHPVLLNPTRGCSTTVRVPIQQRRKELLDKIGAELGVTDLSDWYGITREDVIKHDGRQLFRRYATLQNALEDIYNDYSWDPGLFVRKKKQKPKPRRVSIGERSSKHKMLIDKAARQLGISQITDWYAVQRKDVQAIVPQLFKHYSSLCAALMDVYPHVTWDPHKFRNPQWYKKENVMNALRDAEQRLGIAKPVDWYTVTLSDLKEGSFPTRITRPRLVELLKERYPTFEWEPERLLRGRSAQQHRLESAIASLFPEKEIKLNTRDERLATLELGILIPTLNLAFKYQDRHHYLGADCTYHPVSNTERDQTDRDLASAHGITLITVPCWWDGSTDSLVATIAAVRPDLALQITPGAHPIPAEPPAGFFDRFSKPRVADRSEPTTASDFSQSKVDPKGWWMFEKYDGLRGFWNPKQKKMYSRGNKEFLLPQEIIESLPDDTSLDGELWFGPKSFTEAVKLSRRAAPEQLDWTKFKYMVLDLPDHPGTYAERYRALEELLTERPASKWLQLAPHKECEGVVHLEKEFKDIIDRGGEGVILLDPAAPFTAGHLKHKKLRHAEAKIISREEGTERWECELPNGVRFVAPAGTAEFCKNCDPQPGDVVSFKHHGYLLASRKKPESPTLYRMRPDLSWDDVVRNWKERKIRPSSKPVRRSKPPRRPQGYWNRLENRKAFLQKMAEEAGLDPNDERNMLKIPKALVAEKGFGLLSKYEGSMLKVLANTFPSLNTDALKTKPPAYWRDVENRKQFFNQFAAEMGFDPTDPMGWAKVTRRHVIARKGRGLLSRYNGVLRKALADTFPELKLASAPS